MKNYTKGNTIIEVIIVIAIIVLILAVVGPVVSTFREKQIVKNTAEEVKTLLDEAHINSISSKNSNFYSVQFLADHATFFAGNPPINLTDPETKILNFDPNVTITSSNILLNGNGINVIFDRLTGRTSTYGTIKIENINDPSVSKTITVNKLGIISID